MNNDGRDGDDAELSWDDAQLTNPCFFGRFFCGQPFLGKQRTLWQLLWVTRMICKKTLLSVHPEPQIPVLGLMGLTGFYTENWLFRDIQV